jgi:hypothetical protein
MNNGKEGGVYPTGGVYRIVTPFAARLIGGGGLGMKLATLGVETVLRAFPLPSLPYSATIEGVKLVPTAWELNALRIPASVIGKLLFPSWTDVIACVCVTWFCEVPVVTLSVRERNDEEKGTGVCDILSIYY